MFDVPTLMMTTVILALLMTSVILVAWRVNPDMPGMRLWFLTYLLICVGMLLLALRGAIPPFLSVVVGNMFLCATAFASLAAIRLHTGLRPPHPAVVVAVLAVYTGLMAWYTYVEPSIPARMIVYSLIVSAIYLWSARDALREHASITRPGRVYFATIGIGHSTFLLIRSCIVAAYWSDGVLETRTFWLSQAVFLEGLIATVMFALAVTLLAAEHHANKLRRLSEIDPLTEVLNRRAFLAQFDKAATRARRANLPVSLLAIDLDHFKRVNDTHGHAAGDEVLRRFVRAAAKGLRAEDVFGRIGGEEFAVFLPGAGAEVAASIADRLRALCEAEVVDAGGAKIHFTASFGVAASSDREDAEGMLHRADRALYEAKAAGRNRVVMAS